MATVKMLNMAGQEAGTIELNDELFGIEPNENAVHEVVKNYLANQRPEPKSEEAEESRSDRREQAVTDREAQQTRHRSVVVSYSLQSRETTDIPFRRKSRDWLSVPHCPLR